MGSHFKASTVNMKIFLLAFTLVMLSIQGSEAKRLSCLQCESAVGSESSECVDGTVEGKECPLGMADGCIVIAATGEAAGQSYTSWTRTCCVGNETTLASCSDFHQDLQGVSLHYDQTWCKTDNCNTGDPRNSANALVPVLTILLATLVVMA